MTLPIEQLLASYPRKRPPLSEAHAARYLQDYRDNRTGSSFVTGLAQKLEAWMHRKVAAAGPAASLLEIGAGTLNHVRYEQGYERYDIVEPFIALWKNQPERASITAAYAGIEEIPLRPLYDRIFSIAVLEHLTDLPAVIERAGRLLKPGGIFQAGIPSEGGLAWGLAWRAVTGVAYRLRTGLDYATLMRHEHVNTAAEVIAIVHHYFRRLAVSRFPLPWHQLSFYTYLEAREPQIK